MSKPESIMIDDQKYIRADAVNKEAPSVNGMNCCVIRSYGAGVFCGYVKEQKIDLNGVNVVLINSRRVHYWDGACSLSQLAMEGSKKLDNCRIAMVVTEQFIANVIEIIPMTAKAVDNIMGAKAWKS